MTSMYRHNILTALLEYIIYEPVRVYVIHSDCFIRVYYTEDIYSECFIRMYSLTIAWCILY